MTTSSESDSKPPGSEKRGQKWYMYQVHANFVMAGVSSMAATVLSNPLDVVKTRMQLEGELKTRGTYRVRYHGMSRSMLKVYTKEGMSGLRAGLGPAIWMKLVHSGTRLGIYSSLEDLGFTKSEDGFWIRSVLCGAFAGMMAGLVSSPFYLLKTRAQSRTTIPNMAVGHQHVYYSTSTFGMMHNLYKVYGLKGLYHATGVITTRCIMSSATQLPIFFYAKEILPDRHDIFKDSSLMTTFVSGLVSACLTMLFLTPFDVIATRMANQPLMSHGKGLLYKNTWDCIKKTLSVHGLMGFYKGFYATYTHATKERVITLVIWDTLRRLHDKHVAGVVWEYMKDSRSGSDPVT